jgi:hypothetical protein
MELTLNVGWALVAVVMLYAWVRLAPREALDRRAQFVALAVVILILLPAISINDDLIAAQNPAEVASSVRRDHDRSSPHSIMPADIALPLPAFAGLSIADVPMAAPGHLFDSFVEPPALGSIQNRPPPGS